VATMGVVILYGYGLMIALKIDYIGYIVECQRLSRQHFGNTKSYKKLHYRYRGMSHCSSRPPPLGPRGECRIFDTDQLGKLLPAQAALFKLIQ